MGPTPRRSAARARHVHVEAVPPSSPTGGRHGCPTRAHPTGPARPLASRCRSAGERSDTAVRGRATTGDAADQEPCRPTEERSGTAVRGRAPPTDRRAARQLKAVSPSARPTRATRLSKPSRPIRTARRVPCDGRARRPTGGRRGRPNAARFGGRAALTGVGRHGPSSAHAVSTSRRGKFGSRTRSEDRPAVSGRSRVHCGPLTMRSTVDSAGWRRAAPRGGTAPIVAASNRRLTTWPTRPTPGTTAGVPDRGAGRRASHNVASEAAPDARLRPSAPAWPAPSGPARSSRPASGWSADPAGSPSVRPC